MTSISKFVSKFQHGARANLFRVDIPYLGEDCAFFCKAAQIPGVSIDKVPVRYQNNTLWVGGDNTFQDWSVTVINDKGFGIRKNLESWMSSIKNRTMTDGATNVKEYLRNCYVVQLDERGNDIKEYVFYHMWPTDLSQIELSFDNPDTVQEYTVTFAYSFWETGESIVEEFKDGIKSIKNDIRSIKNDIKDFFKF